MPNFGKYTTVPVVKLHIPDTTNSSKKRLLSSAIARELAHIEKLEISASDVIFTPVSVARPVSNSRIASFVEVEFSSVHYSASNEVCDAVICAMTSCLCEGKPICPVGQVRAFNAVVDRGALARKEWDIYDLDLYEGVIYALSQKGITRLKRVAFAVNKLNGHIYYPEITGCSKLRAGDEEVLREKILNYHEVGHRGHVPRALRANS